MHIKEMVLDTVSQFENNNHDLKKIRNKFHFYQKKFLILKSNRL